MDESRMRVRGVTGAFKLNQTGSNLLSELEPLDKNSHRVSRN
jgi:hypothetical protein